MWKIVLLCILLFLLLLLSIKVSLLFRITNDEYQLDLKILFLKKNLLSSEDAEEEPAHLKQTETGQEKQNTPADQAEPPDTVQKAPFKINKNQKKEPPSQPEKSKENRNDPKQSSPSKEKQSILDKIEMILDFIRPLPEPLKKLIQRFHVTNLRIYIRVAEEDAAETAISYGRMWGIVSGCLAVCRNILKIQLKSLRIEPDFWQQKPLTQVSGQLNLRVYAALAFILRYLWLYLKQTIQKTQTETEKGGVQNESASNRGNVRHIHGKNQGND